MELNGCLQRGHSALLCDHSWMHRKQKRCKQLSRYAKLLKRSRQMGHFESGEASSAEVRGRVVEEDEEGRGEAVFEEELVVVFFLRLLLRREVLRLLSSFGGRALPDAASVLLRRRSFIRVGAIT